MKKKSKVRLVCSIAFYAVFAVVLVTVILMAVSKARGEVFFFGDRAYIWVLTDSMADEIPSSTYIRVKKTEPADVKVGDIITFYSDDPTLGGALNTHRVVRITEDGSFITKGDNNLIEDKYPVRAEKLVGVYEKKSTVLTGVGRMFQSGAGMIVAVVIIAVIAFFTLFYDKLKPRKEKDGVALK